MADIRLIAVDMDGTFMRTDHTYDVERFGRDFAAMRERGMRFATASGNQYWLMRSKFQGAFEHMGFVADNGACVWVGDELISCTSMTREDAELAFDAIFSIEGEDVHRIADGVRSSWIPSGQPQEFFDFMTNFNLRIDWTDDVYAVEDDFLKCAIILPPERANAEIARLNERFGGRLLAVKAAPHCIDIIQPGVNKAAGLAILAEHWGIAPEECACFGDSGNDLEMLEWCGHAYAMENADDALKTMADHICPSNDEDGVLSTIESLLAKM